MTIEELKEHLESKTLSTWLVVGEDAVADLLSYPEYIFEVSRYIEGIPCYIIIHDSMIYVRLLDEAETPT